LKPFDASGVFRSPGEGGGLRRLAVRGAGVTVLAQGVGFVTQMVATVVLARLLMPSDFGVVTMVTTFSVLLVSCGQIGFPDAVVQRDEMDHFLASNLFWINLGLGLVLTIGFAAAGSLLARFYGDPRVARVAVGVSLTIFITSTSVLHLALLKRAMRFSAVSGNDIVARAISVTVSVLLAWSGWGYWALVGGVIAQPLAMSIGAWILCRWVPNLPRRTDGTGSIIRFARNVFARWSVGYFSQNADNLLVGWRFGPSSLGFYKKAYDLFVLPFSLLSVYPVAVSTLSRLNRDRVQYRRYFLGGLSILALVGMGLGADLSLVGKDLVRLILGPKWDMAGRIFVFFGPGIGAMLIYSAHGMIHLSIGTTVRYFRWGIIEVTVTCLMFFLGLPWGPMGIALAWTASYWLLTIPAFWYAGRPIQLGITPILAAIWKYLLASLVAGCACAWIVPGFRSLVAAPGAVGALARIVTSSLLFAALYIGAVIVLHQGCAPLYQLGRLLQEMAPWKKFSRLSPALPASSASDAGLLLAPTRSGEAT
jgi:O-antigen/teichoic acid export membrane protein